jgi:hypothetical protein
MEKDLIAFFATAGFKAKKLKFFPELNFKKGSLRGRENPACEVEGFLSPSTYIRQPHLPIMLRIEKTKTKH